MGKFQICLARFSLSLQFLGCFLGQAPLIFRRQNLADDYGRGLYHQPPDFAFEFGEHAGIVLSRRLPRLGQDLFSDNDGFLRLNEVTSLKLNADLVVLSACRSGQGELRYGEGVSGLARAFLYAGSRGVVCSLWSVADQETASLMTRLYGHLQAGQTARDALRAAKLEMIQAGKPPFFWAPFILIGE